MARRLLTAEIADNLLQFLHDHLFVLDNFILIHKLV